MTKQGLESCCSDEELQQYKDRVDVSIFSQGPVIVFHWRNEEHWPVEFVTPNAILVFGYSAADFFEGRVQYAAVIHPDDLAQVAAEVTRFSESGAEQFQHKDYRIIAKDGSVRWVEDHTQIIRDAEGQITHYLGYVLDITARKVAEETLRNSESEMRAMLHAVPDLMFKVDAEGVFRDHHAINPGDLAMPPEAFLGKRLSEVFPEPMASQGMDCLQRSLTSGEVIHHTYEIPIQDGGLRRFEARYSPSGPDVALIVVRDITALHEAGAALQRSEAQLQSIADAVHIIIWSTDKELCFTSSHGAGLGALDLSTNEVLGMSLYDYFQTQDKTFTPIAAALSALDGYESRYEFEWEDVVFQAEVTPLRDASGDIVGTVGVALDISKRKQAEENLRQSEARFKDLAESMSDWIWEVDAQGVYTYCSGRVEDILGYRPEEIIGRTPFDFMLEDEAGTVAGIFAGIVAKKAPIKNLENWNLAKDGSRVCLLTNGIPLFDDEGGVIGYRGVDSDITERKISEEQLMQAKLTAETASQAKSEFLSRMSHELRTPMNAILGFTELMMDLEEDPLTENQRESLGIIHGAGRHLLDLINEVLDLAKIDSGKLQLTCVDVDWRNVLKQCMELTLPSLEKQGLSLFDETSSDGPVLVKADEVRLRQVLLNLLSNAVKYNRPQGSVILRSNVDETGVFRIEVKDTGEGLTEAQLGELFQPFNRLANTGASTEGVGIGLVISKRLMELMQGDIGVQCVPGEGCTFWLELPTVFD